jgi:hypothetical protein
MYFIFTLKLSRNLLLNSGEKLGGVILGSENKGFKYFFLLFQINKFDRSRKRQQQKKN